MLSQLFSSSVVTTKKKGKLSEGHGVHEVQGPAHFVDGGDRENNSPVRKVRKPNSIKSSSHYDVEMVVDQLRCAGVIEAIRVARLVTRTNCLTREVPRRFGLLCDTSGSTLQLCKALIGEEPATQKRDGPYAVGSTRVYFKAGVLEALERRRADALGERAIVVQARWRQIRHTRRYNNAKKGAMLVQASTAGILQGVSTSKRKPRPS